jgi:HEAT repeat protein
MPEEAKSPEPLSPEAHELMRSLLAAIRAVKIYPPNNPVYSQSVRKTAEALDRYLAAAPEYRIGVQKTYFTHGNLPVGKEAQLNKAIAQDLFAKGIREIVVSDGATEKELLDFLQALALSPEEQAMKSGISSILWEKGATHIKVSEAGLDDVITAKTEAGPEEKTDAQTAGGGLERPAAKGEPAFTGRTLVLGDLMTDPAGFGAGMVELAKKTRADRESVEDRLFVLYQETGRSIREKQPDQNDALFEGLAQSALSLKPSSVRDKLIAGKLYGDLDSETVNEQKDEIENHVPNEFHEILTGRFSRAWTVKQVATLLKRSSAKKIEPPPPPISPDALEVAPVPGDLGELAREMTEYTAEEMETLKVLGEMGRESDIIEAAVRTLIFLLPLVKNPHRAESDEKELSLFSGVVHQLEELQSYLLKQKDYDLSSLIMRALQMPADPAFRSRLAEAVKKNGTRAAIASTITEMRTHPKNSHEYASAFAFLSTLEREATEALLELLAEETDRSIREFLLDLIKEVGKNQILLLGERLTDERWYFVRNIVNILGDSKADQALAFLHKVANHKNARIRQEVVKGLCTIGGKKAAGLLTKFLNDESDDIRFMTIRGLAAFTAVGAEEANALMAFLEERRLSKKDQELTLEAIQALAKIGGSEAREFLTGYTRVRWWRSRKLQRERRDAALSAMEEIGRRTGHGGRRER